ncbi:hypothetical protein IFM47457_06474 [Aspergillus lentulus]|nr:hypothetical protein IFM47457_06474 [Aspergillus lentulus]
MTYSPLLTENYPAHVLSSLSTPSTGLVRARSAQSENGSLSQGNSYPVDLDWKQVTFIALLASTPSPDMPRQVCKSMPPCRNATSDNLAKNLKQLEERLTKY